MGPDAIAARIGALDLGEAKRLRSAYLQQLQWLGGGKPRVVDKLPHNFLHLWLIALLFPKATYVHCMRDPVATCFSCFTTDVGEAHSYTADFDTLAGYYRLYKDLMQHWNSVLPVRLYQHSYEDFVADPEPGTRRLLDAARLSWNDACLSPHETARVAQTASYAQIREPVHSGNIDKWQSYGPHIEPLLAALRREGLIQECAE
jgi:hypothetical protein